MSKVSRRKTMEVYGLRPLLEPETLDILLLESILLQG